MRPSLQTHLSDLELSQVGIELTVVSKFCKFQVWQPKEASVLAPQAFITLIVALVRCLRLPIQTL